MKIMIIGKGKHIFLPIVPYIEDIEQEQGNEEFKTINGKSLNLKGGKNLRKFSITSFFPSKNYNFSNVAFTPVSNYLNFFLKNIDEPVRIIIIAKNLVILNMQCRYNFKYNITDKSGDVPYTLEITEYTDPNNIRSVIDDFYL